MKLLISQYQKNLPFFVTCLHLQGNVIMRPFVSSLKLDLKIWFCFSKCKVSGQCLISQNFLETCDIIYFLFLHIKIKTVQKISQFRCFHYIWRFHVIVKLSGIFYITFKCVAVWKPSNIKILPNYLSEMETRSLSDMNFKTARHLTGPIDLQFESYAQYPS